ncbi:MAG: NrsF family protein [Proteobacteria bacterium]|nr:NrsF family protein [Pseudomonadota bacterium]
MSERDDLDVLDELARRTPGELPALPAQLETALGTLAPVAMRRPLRQLALLVGISLMYGAGVLAIVAVRRDLAEIPTSWMLAAGTCWLLGFVVPAYLATVPAPGAISPRWQTAAVVAGLAATAFVMLGLVVQSPTGTRSIQYGWEHFGKGHTCLEIGLATALCPVIFGAIALRGALPVGARWTAAALGASGGCLGGLVLHLHCYVTDPLHLGLVHGGVVVVAAALAAALVPRATDPR